MVWSYDGLTAVLIQQEQCQVCASVKSQAQLLTVDHAVCVLHRLGMPWSLPSEVLAHTRCQHPAFKCHAAAGASVGVLWLGTPMPFLLSGL